MIIMVKLKYGTYENYEKGEFTEYLDNIQIYEDNDLVYMANLSNRNYYPEWFQNFIRNVNEDINRIMIYELQDGAKLMLRKYTGSKKVYIEAKVSDPVFGPVISYSLIEVGDIPTAE